MSSEFARTKHLIATFKDKHRSTGCNKMGDIQNFDKIPTVLRIAMLHQLLFKIDSDWPYILAYKTASIPATDIKDVDFKPELCNDCGGLVYNNPSLTYSMIKDIAEALNLEPAVFMMVDDTRCKEAFKWLKDKSTGVVGDAYPTLHIFEYRAFSNDEEVKQHVLDMININCTSPEQMKADPNTITNEDQDWDLKFYSHGASGYENTIEARANERSRQEKQVSSFAHVHSGTAG